ncbi:DUF5063 domain-containing protein [Polaribacter septentrionalilitoris]|uniref:DUF5063 domain-containing protein n=1 Tax=Polaribacter septentrionalilitoris TaxID=2494657 RepID=UPI00135C335C|nr:DUF5063 domain-containing protein [Polaribacter septentrionalilitoris]
MSKLKKLIDRIVEFGTNEKLESENKTLEIQRLLVGIYYEYLKVETEFDETDYEEPINLDYDGMRNIVTEHFPEFGWYHSVWESHKINENAELITGDSIDDLTDIIKDLVEVQWRFDNTSEKDAIWNFEFSMRTHLEQHLVDLLKYLKEKND